MTATTVLLATAFGWPLLLAFGLTLRSLRESLPWLLRFAPLPALALAFFGTYNTPVKMASCVFELDAAGGLLLAAAALLWCIAGFTAPSYFPDKRPGAGFTACWLLTMIGSFGVFLAADLIGFLVFYALVSLPAYGLVAHDKTPGALRAGKIYLGFALLGENLLLPAFVLLCIFPSPPPIVPLLLIAGFGAKIALLPLHFWMPPSYTAAPIPAAAVLSGAAVKAGVIGLLRFLPMESTAATWGELLVVVGFCGAFYGVAVGLTQRNPKTVLAYSSISQMGFLAAVIGMGISTHDENAIFLAAFYAAHHTLAKGVLFLAIGANTTRPARIMIPTALVGLGLAGLPLTGGALAKLAVKSSFGFGPAATLASLAAAATAMLMTHFLFRLAGTQKNQPPFRMPPLLIGTAVCLAFPWFGFPLAGLTFADIIAPAAVGKTLWPVLAGVVAAFALRRIRLPEIPAGDILALSEKILPSVRSLASMIARIESLSRRWPTACSLVLVLAITLALLMAFGFSQS